MITVTKSKPVHVFEGCPSFFWLMAIQIRNQTISDGYDLCGRHLTMHLLSHMPYESNDEMWLEQLTELEHLLKRQRLDEAIRWFVVRYPKCMALIPTRRRRLFIKGAYDFYCENGGLF
jgi:hypothetical protein